MTAGRAQPSQPAELHARPEVFVAVTPERLWVARVQAGQTLLTYREPGVPAVKVEPLPATIAALAAAGSDAYVFREDGSFWRYATTWTRAVDLPERQRPIDLVGAGGELYALLPSAVAAKLRVVDRTRVPPASRPFEPGSSAWSLVHYDGRGWSALAGVEMVPAAAIRPRLSHLGGRLGLFWRVPDTPQISYIWYELEQNRWLSGGTLGVPGATGFWVPVVNRLQMLVASVDHGGSELPATFVRVPGAEGAADEWQPAHPNLAPLPAEAGAVQYAAAFGFNQHLGLLAIAGERAYLQFGRFDGPPAMPVEDVLFETPLPTAAPDLQAVRAVVVIAVLGGLLLLRRGAVVTPARLPAGVEIAFALQRLGAAAVDLLPFALITGLVVGVNVPAAAGQLGRWAFDPSPSGTTPVPAVMLWWLISIAGYTVYSLIMELVRGRTLGKALLHLELLTEAGQRPAAWQVVTRNLFRLIEVIPLFWILGFLVLLSRNRQRAGDLFARTVVVRRAAPQSAAGDTK